MDELIKGPRGGMTLPNMLRIVDGELVCADGSDVREYLRAFAAGTNTDAETPVVIMRRDAQEATTRDAFFWNNRAA